MEPKFQSSFIPKGPASTTSNFNTVPRYTAGKKNFFAFIAVCIFVISLVLALGIFGYKMYLDYRINQMSQELDQAWATLQPDVIKELIRLDSRFNSTQTLISRHQVVTPIFEFLETSTPVTVRYQDFTYSVTDQGIDLSMRGEARGYTALALQADVFNNSQYFKEAIFSDFELNAQGNVNFSFKAKVDPNLVSYQKSIEALSTPPPIPVTPVATSTATSTPN